MSTDDILGRLRAFEADVEKLTEDTGGILRCTVCGEEKPVESRYWWDGWPSHCDTTMRWVTAQQMTEETT